MAKWIFYFCAKLYFSRRRRHHSSNLQRRRRTLALASMVSGQVAVFECAKAKLEETDLIPPFGGGGGMAATRGGPNHTTCDGEWLLFGGSRRDLVLYDLDRRREVRRMRNRHRVWALRMRYPLAATSGVVAEGEEAEEDNDVGLREGSEDQEDMGRAVFTLFHFNKHRIAFCPMQAAEASSSGI